MAFLYCKKCNFNQDDFWTDTYNPIRYMLEWEKCLLHDDLDVSFTDDDSFIKKNGDITKREVIAREMEKAAKDIRKMTYRDSKELENKNPNHVCPICGSDLEID